MSEPDFAVLIERVRNGDDQAFSQLVDQYGEAIRREIRFSMLDTRLRRVVGDSDIFQSVVTRLFVGLWAGKYEFECPQQFVGLLKDIARKNVADKARYWNSQKRDMRRNCDVDGAPRTDKHLATPSQIVANAELLDAVRDALPEADREVLAWRQQRIGWPEIARRLDTDASPEAIRKRYERALAKASDELGVV